MPCCGGFRARAKTCWRRRMRRASTSRLALAALGGRLMARDDARAIAAAHLARPPLDIVSKERCGSEGAVQSVWKCLAVSRRRARRALPGFEEGEFWVQDAAATLPATLLGDVRGTARDRSLCRAGRQDSAARRCRRQVVAVEREATRLARLKENLDAAETGCDAASTKMSAMCAIEPAPFVLLDAPCTRHGHDPPSSGAAAGSRAHPM